MAQYGGNLLPDETLDAIRETGVALKGPITTPVGGGFRSVNVGLRKGLDLYAQVRPCKTYPGVRTRLTSTSSSFARTRRTSTPGSSTSRARTTRPSCSSGSRARWEAPLGGGSRSSPSPSPGRAESSSSHSTTCPPDGPPQGDGSPQGEHHGKFTDGLWLHVAREVAAENDDVEFDDRIVDNMHAASAAATEEYDVLVLPEPLRRRGLRPLRRDDRRARDGAGRELRRVGRGVRAHARPAGHAGQNKVNPMAQMLSGVLMLRLDEHDAADRLEAAIGDVIREGERHLRHEACVTTPAPSARASRRRDRRQARRAGVVARSKVTVVGAGNVGATCAHVLAQRDHRRRPRRHQARAAPGEGARHRPDGCRARVRAEGDRLLERLRRDRGLRRRRGHGRPPALPRA